MQGNQGLDQQWQPPVRPGGPMYGPYGGPNPNQSCGGLEKPGGKMMQYVSTLHPEREPTVTVMIGHLFDFSYLIK